MRRPPLALRVESLPRRKRERGSRNHHESSAFASRLVLALVANLLLLVSWSAAEVPLAPLSAGPANASSVQIADLLRVGEAMEKDRQWAEALTYYEDAMRKYPAEESLHSRFQFCRLHYDLGRRYRDNSYCDLLDELSFADALRLYLEVVVKIQVQHVDAPQWRELVDHGTDNLEIALSEPAFGQRYLSGVDPATTAAFCRQLRETLAAMTIESHDDAQNAVLQATAMAERQLHLPPQATILEYTCGAANSLDAYSAFLTPGQLNDTYAQIDGNFVGLGVELTAKDGILRIVRVIEHSPAEAAGIHDGDVVLSVDGQSTQGVTTDQAASLLQGEDGSIATLVIVSGQTHPRVVQIRRQRVEVPSVSDVRMLNPASGVAYLKLTCFQKTTCRDLDIALWDLHRQGMRSLIMDLRKNPGGLLIAGKEVADKFIQEGVIVTTRGRGIRDDFTYYARKEGTWRVPLVVMIDDESASAAEIFAGAIRDHGRGTIVGTRSYGKGSMQGIFQLAYAKAGLRLTTAKLYSPKGFGYSGIGVEPHIPFQESPTHMVAKPVAGSLPAADDSSDHMLEVARDAARMIAVPR